MVPHVFINNESHREGREEDSVFPLRYHLHETLDLLDTSKENDIGLPVSKYCINKTAHSNYQSGCGRIWRLQAFASPFLYSELISVHLSYQNIAISCDYPGRF